ncbi:MAG: hypothetical protein GXN92_00550 [Candidatus Micrarchaeota archaeon]|nr:hypothetical protein [Candidatus Micrarchaeota archaeon]
MEVRVNKDKSVSVAYGPKEEENVLVLSRELPESRLREILVLEKKRKYTYYTYLLTYLGGIVLYGYEEKAPARSFDAVKAHVNRLIEQKNMKKLAEYVINKMIEWERKAAKEEA